MSKLQNAIYARAVGWAKKLTTTAKGLAPAHLRPYISSHVTPSSTVSDRWDIIVQVKQVDETVGSTKKGSGDARARELGAGLHATAGRRDKYPIFPKGGHKYLAFKWDMVSQPKDAQFLPDGRILLTMVMHPGFAAANGGQGYLRPAIKQVLNKIEKRELAKDIREALIGDISAGFKNAKH